MPSISSLGRAQLRFACPVGLSHSALRARTSSSAAYFVSRGFMNSKLFLAEVSLETPEAQSQDRMNSLEPKYERNQHFRSIFKEANRLDTTDPRMEKLLQSPFVPPVREYPSPAATKESCNKAKKVARRLAALEKVWGMSLSLNHYNMAKLSWEDMYLNMKDITPREKKTRNISAIRVVLPKSWDLDVSNQKIEYVESSTGLAARLRTSPDHKSTQTVVLRGWKDTLAKVADELVKACKDVKIFELGEVESHDYQSKQLWPAIAGDGKDYSLVVPEDKLDTLWVHKEETEQWIDTPYEDIPRPASGQWTTENFADYVKTIACSHLRKHLALPLYKHQISERSHRPREEQGTRSVDTTGVRVKLILSAFEDPTAQHAVTAASLKTALTFLAQAGGYRATANTFFTYAEDVGFPIDTEAFNIMLEGYAMKGDFRSFHKFLRKMRFRYFNANARTWLIFLQFIQKPELRQSITTHIFGTGMSDDVALRQGLAAIDASQAAYWYFSISGEYKGSVKEFLKSRDKFYKGNWITREAINCILVEYLRCRSLEPFDQKRADLFELLRKIPDDGRPIDIGTINIILEQSRWDKDWEMAVWALSQMEKRGLTPNALTYASLIDLAIETKFPRTLGVILFYAITERETSHYSRSKMHHIFTGDTDRKFWHQSQPFLFNTAMARLLMDYTEAAGTGRISRSMIMKIIWEVCNGLVPAQPLVDSVNDAMLLDLSQPSAVKAVEIRVEDPHKQQSSTTMVLEFSPLEALASAEHIQLHSEGGAIAREKRKSESKRSSGKIRRDQHRAEEPSQTRKTWQENANFDSPFVWQGDGGMDAPVEKLFDEPRDTGDEPDWNPQRGVRPKE